MKESSPAALPAAETFVAVLGGAEAAADAQVARLAQTWESVQGQPLAAKGIGPQLIMHIKASGSGLDFVLKAKRLTPVLAHIAAHCLENLRDGSSRFL